MVNTIAVVTAALAVSSALAVPLGNEIYAREPEPK
jgi:hypothetical protein